MMPRNPVFLNPFQLQNSQIKAQSHSFRSQWKLCNWVQREQEQIQGQHVRQCPTEILVSVPIELAWEANRSNHFSRTKISPSLHSMYVVSIAASLARAMVWGGNRQKLGVWGILLCALEFENLEFKAELKWGKKRHRPWTGWVSYSSGKSLHPTAQCLEGPIPDLLVPSYKQPLGTWEAALMIWSIGFLLCRPTSLAVSCRLALLELIYPHLVLLRAPSSLQSCVYSHLSLCTLLLPLTPCLGSLNQGHSYSHLSLSKACQCSQACDWQESCCIQYLITGWWWLLAVDETGRRPNPQQNSSGKTLVLTLLKHKGFASTLLYPNYT